MLAEVVAVRLQGALASLASGDSRLETLEPPARDRVEPQSRRSGHGAHVRRRYEYLPLVASRSQITAHGSEPRLTAQHEADRVASARFAIDPSLNPGSAFRHAGVVS